MTGQAQRGGGGIALTHSQPGARKKMGGQHQARPLYLREIPGTPCTGGWKPRVMNKKKICVCLLQWK